MNNSLSLNTATAIINIFVSPQDTIHWLREKRSFLAPLTLVVGSGLGLYLWYFYIVDYPWMIRGLIDAMGDIPIDEAETVEKTYESLSLKMMTITTCLSAVIFPIIISLIQASYLSLASSLNGSSVSFRHWFSLVTWNALPGLLIVVTGIVNILLAEGGRVSLLELNSLSFSNLGLSVQDDPALRSMLDSLNLTSIWSLGLLAFGYQQWTSIAGPVAFFIVSAPYALVFGVWAAFVI